MLDQNDRLSLLEKTQRRLRVSKNKLTAIMTEKERSDILAEVSDCVSDLIELGEEAPGDERAKRTPGRRTFSV